MKTALIRINGNLKVAHDNDCTSNKEFAEELRGNGYKVLKIWNEYKTDKEVEEWELLNRK